MSEPLSNRELISQFPAPKIILPGEYGLTTSSQPIGTFAVGAENGCRGYYVIGSTTKQAAVAHVDFWSLDENVLNNMKKMFDASESLRLGYTPNTKILQQIVQRFGSENCFVIPSPQFLYFPSLDRLDTTSLPQHLMQRTFEERKGTLKNRLKTADSPLLLV
ncbi:MAG: hypothetical protein WCJ70_05265 [bacterium]